jgi:type I restriction enzyme S subunit
MAELGDFVEEEANYEFREEEAFIETSSGWINQIPSNWSIMKITRCLKSLDSGSRENYEGEDGAFSIGGEHITETGNLSTENEKFVSDEFYRSMNGGQLRTNDVLLVKDGATIGKNAIVDEIPYGKAAVNSHVYLLRGKEFCSNRFLYYLIDSEIVQEQIQVSITDGTAERGVL